MAKFLILWVFILGSLNGYAQNNAPTTKTKIRWCGSPKGFYFRLFMWRNVGFERDLIGQGNGLGGNQMTNTYARFGDGVGVGWRVGYLFTPHIGGDLGFLWGGGTYASYHRNYSHPNGIISFGQTLSTSYSMLNPAFLLTTRQDKTINAYTRLGLLFGFSSGTLTTRRGVGTTFSGDVDTTINLPSYYKYDLKFRVGVGASVTVGMDVNISPLIALYGELNLFWLSVKLQSATDDNFNGKIYANDSSTVIPKEFTADNGFQPTEFNPNPKLIRSEAYNLSSIGLFLGIKFSFGKKYLKKE